MPRLEPLPPGFRSQRWPQFVAGPPGLPAEPLLLPGALIVAGLRGPARVAYDRAGRGRRGRDARGVGAARGGGSARQRPPCSRPTQAAASTAGDKTGPSGIWLSPRDRRHRRPAGFLQRGVQRFNRRPQQHLPAVRPRARARGRRIDSLIRPPVTGGKQPATLYDSYGMAGQSWAAYDMQCSDMTSLIGNSVAGMVFDASKALDRGDHHRVPVRSLAQLDLLSWLTSSGGPADHQPGQRDLLPVPGPGGHHRRDLAGLGRD